MEMAKIQVRSLRARLEKRYRACDICTCKALHMFFAVV